MRDLAPCDLGEGLEVLHDVEAVEVEMDCDLGEDAPADAGEAKGWFDELWLDAKKRQPSEIGLRAYLESAPYARIEIADL